MNRRPLRDISSNDIQTYQRDGVVCLREVFDQDWIDLLLPITRAARMDRQAFGLLPTVGNPRYMARTIPQFRQYAFRSPLGEACGKVLESKTVRFFFDEVFSKEPKSTSQTIWHNDRTGWPVSGHMVPSFWFPLTPISKKNSLECIAGSHTTDVLYWIFSPNARKMVQPPDRPIQPDGEALRDDPNYTFLSWDMNPGDVLIIHPWTLHFSCGNPTDDWRFAISTRVVGDDIVWDPRPECVNLAGVSFDEMIPGEKPNGPLFPIIYNEDGNRDDAEDYPMSFATAWSTSSYDRLQDMARPKGGFQAFLKQAGGPTPVSKPIKTQTSEE